MSDYTPIFLSEIPALFRDKRMHIDIALIQVFHKVFATIESTLEAGQRSRHVCKQSATVLWEFLAGASRSNS